VEGVHVWITLIPSPVLATWASLVQIVKQILTIVLERHAVKGVHVWMVLIPSPVLATWASLVHCVRQTSTIVLE
jgi:hypothetical protein